MSAVRAKINSKIVSCSPNAAESGKTMDVQLKFVMRPAALATMVAVM